MNAWSQNVGIGTKTPNASAVLDISSANKGVLFPNVALVSISDATTVLNPATGLVLYNMGTGGLAPEGLYVNVGTPALPNWSKVTTREVTANNGVSINPSNNIQLGGNLVNATTVDKNGNDFSISGNGNFAVSGGTVNLNTNSNFPVNIATGTATSNVNLGSAANTVVLGTNDVTSNVNVPKLVASKAVFTDASKNLSSTGSLAVDQGGTGLTSIAAHGVVIGGTTAAGPLSVVPPSTAGLVLTSNGTGAAPSWQTATGSVVNQNGTGSGTTFNDKVSYIQVSSVTINAAGSYLVFYNAGVRSNMNSSGGGLDGNEPFSMAVFVGSTKNSNSEILTQTASEGYNGIALHSYLVSLNVNDVVSVRALKGNASGNNIVFTVTGQTLSLLKVN